MSPISYDPKLKLMLISFSGILTELALGNTLSAALEFAQRTEIEMSITDATAVIRVELSAAFIRRLVASTPMITPNRKRVIVAPSSDGYGLARLFFTHRDPESEKTFVVRTMAEAHRLLGIDNPRFRAIPNPARSIRGDAASA